MNYISCLKKGFLFFIFLLDICGYFVGAVEGRERSRPGCGGGYHVLGEFIKHWKGFVEDNIYYKGNIHSLRG